jgi:hypothetical protein
MRIWLMQILRYAMMRCACQNVVRNAQSLATSLMRSHHADAPHHKVWRTPDALCITPDLALRSGRGAAGSAGALCLPDSIASNQSWLPADAGSRHLGTHLHIVAPRHTIPPWTSSTSPPRGTDKGPHRPADRLKTATREGLSRRNWLFHHRHMRPASDAIDPFSGD